VTSPARKSGSRKSTPRKAGPRKQATAASEPAPRGRRAAPATPTRRAPEAVDTAEDAALTAAPAAGSVDLAGGLRDFLDEVGTEVRAVTTLSVHIDRLVEELNGVRDEQATRLAVLDTLRASVDDDTLGAFLDKAIRPRLPRVAEVVPERLAQP
jgi:hypothetical protein